MHVLLWTAIGLAALLAVVLISMLIERGRATRAINSARIFTGFWFVAALANGYNGWANHGIPLVNEIAAFIPIFGIPAAAAWFWSRRTAREAKQ